jgi:hypothetical protein
MRPLVDTESPMILTQSLRQDSFPMRRCTPRAIFKMGAPPRVLSWCLGGGHPPLSEGQAALFHALTDAFLEIIITAEVIVDQAIFALVCKPKATSANLVEKHIHFIAAKVVFDAW